MQKSFLSTFFRFMEPALQNKWAFFASLLIYVFWKIYEIVNVMTLTALVKAIERGDSVGFSQILLLFLSFIIGYQIFNYFYQKRFWFYEYAMVRYVNEKYLSRLIDIQNSHIESLGSAKVMTIFMKGMDYWVHFIVLFAGRSVSILIMLGFTAFMLTKISWVYFVILLGIGTVFNIIAVKLRNVWLELRKKKHGELAEYNRKVLRFIMSKHEIMQNDRMDAESSLIGECIWRVDMLDRKKWVFEHFAFNSMEVGIVLVRTAILYGVGMMIFRGAANLSELVGIVSLIGYLSSTAQSFVDMIKDFAKNGVNLTQFWEFLDTSPRIANLHAGVPYIHEQGDILISGLTYAYEKSNIFEDFSLQITWGTKTAFVWASGSGKTTLMKLIAGYISPQQWEILIDSNDLSTVRLLDYYKKVGYLTQEPSIFDGTLYENLVYALDEKPHMDEVHRVIGLAKCEFIYEFERGLDTEIWEKGVRLSGWQRQRLAIAKIMLKNPDIILLDEPTSALDSFNEEQISIALENLFEGKTVVIIAHRLQTVKNADQILVFEAWKILERGTHEELVLQNGKYKRMLELQSGF